MRDKLESVWRQMGGGEADRPAELEEPEVPDGAEYLMGWFFDLARSRGNNGFSASPISYAEMAAWAQLTHTEPQPWEVAAIREMDAAFLDEIGKLKDDA
jgi:hypothetical protein